MKKFKVGDRVRVRSWDDMAKEFGLKSIPSLEFLNIPSESYIDTPRGFYSNMRYLCKETGVVDTVEDVDWAEIGKKTKNYAYMG